MKRQTFPVIGMMCAGCAANVEKRLRATSGVTEANVNLAARTVLVDYDERLTSPQALKESLAATGYELIADDGEEGVRSAALQEQRTYATLRRRMWLSWLFALLTMGISMGWLPMGSPGTANQSMLIIALLNIVYCGRGFYLSAWRQTRNATANMDTLVTLSTAISLLFSAFNTFWGDRFWGARGMEWHCYYDASVMIISFVLTGRLLEEKAKNSTASAIKSLMGLAPKTAHLVADGAVADTPISTLAPGDVIEVRAGEKFPVDGVVVSGEAQADESMLTGEAVPVAKGKGAKVYAGTLVSSGTLRFKAEEVGAKTVLAGIIRMVREAQGSKAPVQKMVDKLAAVFVPVVASIAILTFVAWFLVGGEALLPRAILSAVSVLVVACPCAMGLATPTALMVGIGKAAERNILVKDATALETLRRVDAMVIDKTGTLTMPCEDSPRHEQLKPHAREAMEQLGKEGIDIHMMSGDREEAAAFWAAQAGIAHHGSQALPQDKEDLVRRLQVEGRTVAMVGDGVNDSQALAAADVSIAMGRGTDVAMDVAQVTLMGDDLRRLHEAVLLSRRTVAMIRQNLFWAFVYNIICIPLAAGVLAPVADFQITPVWASALMALSSVSVVLNSLRLKWQSFR